jgi:tetratricopeptide (TPR) repeat protein
MIRHLAMLTMALMLGALIGCGGGPAGAPEPVDRELARRFDVAAAAYEQRRFGQAAKLFAQAAAYAYLRDDLEAAADAHYNQAVSLVRSGQPDQATTALDRAEHAARLDGREPSADLLILRGRLTLDSGDPGQAEQLARRVLQRAAANPATRAQAQAILGQAAIQRQNAAAAGAALSQLQADPTTRHARAEAAHLQGALAMLDQRFAMAGEAFDREAMLRRETGTYLSMAEALASSAEAHERLGQASEAADRYLRAGRSAAEQGRTARARDWLNRAITLADQADDHQTRTIAEDWLQSVNGD